MLDLSGYTAGAPNEPLTNARILWDMVGGTVSADGTNPEFAANDYTAQRWTLASGQNNWTLTLPAQQSVDTVFISAHNLSGTTVTISTSPDLVTAFTQQSSFAVSNNSTIAAMFNDGSANPVLARRIRINVSEGNGIVVGIIRAGRALQMQRPFYGGFPPARLNRISEGQQSFSETGQWLGRTLKRRALAGSYNWNYLTADWYRANFEPFALTLPLKPFGIISNPSAMPDDVVWAWAQGDVRPVNMGLKDLMQVGLEITGYWS